MLGSQAVSGFLDGFFDGNEKIKILTMMALFFSLFLVMVKMKQNAEKDAPSDSEAMNHEYLDALALAQGFGDGKVAKSAKKHQDETPGDANDAMAMDEEAFSSEKSPKSKVA